MSLQIKEIRHIKLDFGSDAWAMPQGWDFGVPGFPGIKKNFEHGHVRGISNDMLMSTLLEKNALPRTIFANS